jgi:YYY domain-containing protein
MIAFISWYLALLVIGWLAYPIAYRLFSHLPERGYALTKALGLLFVAFVFWILVSLGVLQNDGGGVAFSLLLLGGLSLFLVRGRIKEIRFWLKENLRVVVTSEVLFLAAFGLWAIVRATAPDASGTEKPMELAFINAILHSPQFPPHDPWLSGYAISYYYFGYVMVALLSRLASLPGEVGFNLGVASWFGLTAVTAYGVLYNLLDVREGKQPGRPARGNSAYWALLAPLFILLMSNANGLLEILHADGVFWEKQSTGASVSPFWKWLDIQELNQPPAEPYRLAPNRDGGIWWWRSSRVLTDYDMNGAPREVIDEFPAFSFVLGDLHPHVLSMPFALLAVGLALSQYLKTRQIADPFMAASTWPPRADFWAAALVIGGLAFLNIWDFPIYLGLYCAAFLVARGQTLGWNWARFKEVFYLGILLGMVGVVLYLPFYTGFSSQAGGILPSLSFFTRGIHFWVMFSPLLLPLIFWLWSELPKENRRGVLLRGLGTAAILVFGLWLISYLVGAGMTVLPNTSELLRGIQGGAEPVMYLMGSFAKRLALPGMWLSMLGILSLVAALVRKEAGIPKKAESLAPAEYSQEMPSSGNSAKSFVLLLVLVGCGLVLFPEFFYLRDQFGWRMNTIFKFYFQAWILWGLAAAYASAWLWQKKGSALTFASRLAWCLLVACSLIFAYFGVATRLQGVSSKNWSLDGAEYIKRYQRDDYDAIAWLRDAPDGALVEAVGGSYSDYARVSAISGKPGLLGWPGHESQWRGGGAEMGSREQDIEVLYSAIDWESARQILDKYNIRYVYVGTMEMGKYKVKEDKFKGNMDLVFENNAVRIYESPASLYIN